MRIPSLRVVLGTVLLVASAEAFVWPNTVEEIERDLASHDVSTRRGAAARIVDLPRGRAVALVLRALDDPDDEVRLAAARAAVDLNVAGAAERVIPWLNDPEKALRLAAAEVLQKCPDPRAVAPLARVLGDQDAAVRAAAAAALGKTGDPAATSALLGHLDDSMPNVREVVVDALAELGDASAVMPLIGKVQDPRVGVRRRVVSALGELGDARAASALLLALEDADVEVVVAALGALARLGARSATPAIASLLERHDEVAVRLAAVRALARIGSPQGIDALVNAMAPGQRGVDPDVVAAALVAVGPAALPRLRECLAGQPAPGLADGCAEVLGAMATAEAVQPLTEALRRGVVRPPVALAALAKLGRPESVTTVLEYLDDPDAAVRQAAVAAAARLLDPRHPDGRAVEPIARALAAPGLSVHERAELAALLGLTGSPRGVPLLAPLAAESDAPELRVAALQALGDVPPAGQDRVLIEALDAESGAIRWAAAVALRRSASGAAASVLLERFEQEPEQDRVALAVALAGALSRNEDPALVRRVGGLVEQSRGGERDALLEALGHARGKEAPRVLLGLLARTAAIADRAKIAESLARHPSALKSLERLAHDVDGGVRANAVWSLGTVGTSATVAPVRAALADPDVAVAGNAAAALGRLGVRTRARVDEPLCKALEDPRPYVRANALSALAVVGKRCAAGTERQLVAGDSSPLVRRAAALLLARKPGAGAQAQADAAALARCGDVDTDGAVAAACSNPPPLAPKEEDSITVYVVPAGESSPRASAPFALVLPDGLMRLGVTDRRGVVDTAAVQRGTVTLAVPAPLAR